jgi:adenosyl cobinamide kinase/adenosyl cobinamide phosphate guanylyltransferase
MNLSEAALALHALGFNVCAIARGSKTPAHPWNDPLRAPWTTTRQPRSVVVGLGWGWRQQERIHNGCVYPPIDRIGLICGVGHLRGIDIDAGKDPTGRPRAPVPESVYRTLCAALDLPPDYPWGGRSASGCGWHLLLRCPDPLPTDAGVLTYAPILPSPEAAWPFGALELRWERCLIALPRHGDQIGYHPRMLHVQPAERPLEAILAAVERIAAPARGRGAPPLPDPAWDGGSAASHAPPPLPDPAWDGGSAASHAPPPLPDPAWDGGNAASHAPPPLRLTVVWGADIDRIPPPVPLVHGWLTLGQVALLVGPSESGKSTVAVHLACTVAQHYPVLYVAAENSGGVRNQIRAWEQVHQRPRGSIGVILGPIRAADPGTIAALRHTAGACHARLIVVDTLSACLPGVDENNAQEMSAIVDALNRLAAATDAAVLVLHHPTKSGSAYRGHSTLVNNTNSLHVLAPDPAIAHGVVLTTERHRGERRPPCHLVIGVVPVAETHYTDPRYGVVRSPVVLPPDSPFMPPPTLSPCQHTLLRILADLDGDGPISTTDLIRMVAASVTALRESVIRRELAAAVRRGWITGGETMGRRITASGRTVLDAVEAARGAPHPAFEVNVHLPPLQPPLHRASAAPVMPGPPPGTAPIAPPAAADDVSDLQREEDQWHEC